MNREKLETIIERQAFKFLTMIKESASDSVMLWANRNRVDIDVVLLQKILDQYKMSIENEYLAKVDHFMKSLDKDLAKFSEEENPLHRSDESKPSKKSSKKSA
jgi:hypothetical protein